MPLAQSLRLGAEVTEIVRLCDLGDLARFFHLIDLDPQFLHLPSQALLTCVHLARHILKDAGQLSQ
jgi:hypothetical protein